MFFDFQTDHLVGPNGPGIGVALLDNAEGGQGTNVLMRAGSLDHFDMDGCGTKLSQIRAIFSDTSEAHRLQILRDLRLFLQVPFPGETQYTKLKTSSYRLFKPLTFTNEGRYTFDI